MPRVATDIQNLYKLFPLIAQEWHPSKNGKLTPKDVLPMSHKKAMGSGRPMAS